MRGFSWVPAAALVLILGGGAWAQSGGLTVIVSDEAGAPLGGASVTLSHQTGAVKRTVLVSDVRGVVDFPVLPAGVGYAIEVSAPGLGTLRFDGLRVKINESNSLPVQLVGEMEETVRVSARREVIAIDKSQTSTKFSDDFIRDLPVAGRFYQDVLTLAPGVQDADGDGNPNVHGSRSRDFQALVSGVSNVDPLTGQWMSRVNPNSIAEIDVITAGAGVEFGRAQGGYAVLIQKQGTNRHEGVVEAYWQSSKLDGASGQVDPTALDQGTAEFETFQPLVQFSGPLVRDALWYRFSYEQRNREEPIDVLTGTRIFEENTENLDAQLTWQVSPRNKLALQYRTDPADRINVGISNLVPPESSKTESRDVRTFSLAWTAPVSPRVLVHTTVAWQELNPGQTPTSSGRLNDCASESRERFLRTAQCRDLTTNRISGSYFRADDDRRQRLSVRSRATVFAGRFLGADHQFKVGFNIENERYFRTLVRNPTMTFEVVPPSMVGDDPFGIALTRLAVPGTDDVRATGTNWAIYAEDQIKPRPDLTVTLGLRLDREELSSEGRGQFEPEEELARFEELIAGFPIEVLPQVVGSLWPPTFTGFERFKDFQAGLQALICAESPPDEIGGCLVTVAQSINAQNQLQLQRVRRGDGIDISNTNVSPFVAVAWSPGGDGRTALKGSIGRHYNNLPLVIPLQELEPVFTDVEYRVNLTTQQTEIFGGISPTLNTVTVDRALRTPYQDEWTVSIERELWRESSLSLTYISRKFRDQLQDLNVNNGVGDFGTCRFANLLDTRGVVPRPGGGPGSGIFVQDPFTGEIYEDTDPGNGDGRLDDCAGAVELVPFAQPGGFGAEFVRLPRPDGVLDAYYQSPFWGDILRIGNYNEIDYEAVVLEFVRRQFRGWEMNGSYTWSEAVGDGEDFFQQLDRQPGETLGVELNDPTFGAGLSGFQSYDQRHVVKVNAATVTRWGVRLGAALSWQSGLPYSLVLDDLSIDVLPPSTAIFGAEGSRVRQEFPTGRRNDQRNPSYWNLDLRVAKELQLGRDTTLQLSAEVFNALDEETVLIWNSFTEQGVQLNGTNESFRRAGRRWQLGMRFGF